MFVFLFTMAIYLPVQEYVLLYIGDDTSLSLAVIPILFCGWYSGPLWAIVSGGIIMAGFTLFKIITAGTGSVFEISVGCGSLAIFTLIAIAIGKMEQLNRQLRVELVARTRAEQALQQRTVQLLHSNHELEQFAYIASHDLQEPLRKITSFSSRLISKYTGVLDEQGCDYLTRMDNAAVRMQSLIDGLLTFSRVTTKGQPFATVNLSDIVRDVLCDLETAIKECDAAITCDSLPVIEADALQMRQLFQNLIGNAVKYRRHGVAPVVSVKAQTTEMSCIITIADNGIGFEQKYAEQIFGVFQRLHGRNSEYKGSGIGLSVCRKIVDRHSGTIVATAVPDSGATFVITLPLCQQQSKEEKHD